MANVVRGSKNILISMEKRQHFQRAMELMMSIGSATMRELTKTYLKAKGVTLAEHLIEKDVKETLEKYIYLCKENFQTINSADPSLDRMDISLLTVLISHTFPKQISEDIRWKIKCLRTQRNHLAHAVKAELDNDVLFKESAQIIVGLGKCIGPRNEYADDLTKTINELRKRELVNTRSNLERVKINNEMFVVKLVESDGTDSNDSDNTLLMINIGLTKWTRQLSRGVHVETFLQKLKDDGVINDTVKRQIEESYSYEEQMQYLILHMLNETRANVYKLCTRLRTMAPLLADLIENTNTDGREVDKYLDDYQHKEIIGILKENLEKAREQEVKTERVHIFVEEQLGVLVDFNTIRCCILKLFPDVRHMEHDCSFVGLVWKGMISKTEQNISDDSTEPTHLSNLNCENFAQYVSEILSKIKAALSDPIKHAIVEESISPLAFRDMSKDEMKEIFTPYLESIKFGIGIQKEFIRIQRLLKNENVTMELDHLENLRHFDTPFGKANYRKFYVRPQTGNLLVPKHEFRLLSSDKQYTRHFVAKEVVRFVAACINGRKNGTMHFGIKPISSGTGHIIGIPADSRCIDHLNDEIATSIETCFKDCANIALRCTRPVQVIPVEDGGVVIEVDVVPFSRHITTNLLTINFPPKGCQNQQCFVYDFKPDCQILPVVANKVNEIEKGYNKLLRERKQLEEETDKTGNRQVHHGKELIKLITGGNKYVTDEYVPIIVSGKITGAPTEADIRSQLDMERVFKSAKLVLDFDSSVMLRNKVERDQMFYNVKTAEDLIVQNDISLISPTWVYCNGNEELSKEAMPMEQWLENRSDGVKNAMDVMKQLIPKSRAKLIFLVYQSDSTGRDPLYEIARMAFVSSFRNQCIVLAENEEVVMDFRKELRATLGDRKVEHFFHIGLKWAEISRLVSNVCRMNPDSVCKLPHCDGSFVEMTKKERDDLKFTDIDILSGEECVDKVSKMSEVERKANQCYSQERFYHGDQATWWNFYYKTHVGERDHFVRHKNEIHDKLTGNKGDQIIDVHEIEHHPGAGGSTLGRHLLWHFSQFMSIPETSYRCCVVKDSIITEETIKQIEQFRSFRDGDCPKPIIVLADNINEDNVILLRSKLHELAYKTGCPGKLFCLILLINRMPISHKTLGKPLLKHKLNDIEKNWFDNKYKEMERSDIDVKTLISFNFMRKSFDPMYMCSTVDSIMQGVSNKEMEVLKCLALISSYESDHPVPENVFDQMMNDQIDNRMLIGLPWGITHTMAELNNIANINSETWNMHISNAMDLLITKKNDIDFCNSGVCLVSLLLAKTVLEYIKQKENSSMESIVNNVLDMVEVQKKESNFMSKRFVQIVCSLFKTRQRDKDELKEKFSDLILELEHPVGEENVGDANQKVLQVMQRCFDITEDAMVGQQLARFYKHIKEFAAAEVAILDSLAIKPQSSYLLDTHGQIFKSEMECRFDTSLRNDSNIDNNAATEIINLAFRAIELFQKGQEISTSKEGDANWSCFNTEVITALYILEKFEKFACYTDRSTFVSFLNDSTFEVNESQLLPLIEKCPSFENLRAGHPVQCHIETSLRILEERSYQVKRQLYTVQSENETLLLKMRERFERFYGSLKVTSKYQFTYGIGLKPLMVAKEQKDYLLVRRVKEAKENLDKRWGAQADERDLLVYLGDAIITLSSQAIGNDTSKCSDLEYRRLLSYSNQLVSIQTSSPKCKRPYLETFLYHAMLHWPLTTRTSLELDVLCRPKAYEHLIQQWEEAYNKNYNIKSTEQQRKYKPKNYFALGKGTPGNDIVDLEFIEKEWRTKNKSTGRVRKPDNFWGERFVEERLERLDGTINGSGNLVKHKAVYPLGTHTFSINTYYPCAGMSNRNVTFVLGFTWKGPTAFDVKEKGNTSQPLNQEDGPSTLSSDSGHSETGTHLDGEQTTDDVASTTASTVHSEDAPTSSIEQNNELAETAGSAATAELKEEGHNNAAAHLSRRQLRNIRKRKN